MTENRRSLDVIGRHADPSAEPSASLLNAALAETHEQVSDVYMEGTIEAGDRKKANPPFSQPE
ncbi:YozQ family protein [Geobacillus sp. YF-1]|uniref:YozQ family protein n=1 Tax=Geobacillus sp. YF-1 TaxID=3457480 RepID=UPI00404528C4